MVFDREMCYNCMFFIHNYVTFIFSANMFVSYNLGIKYSLPYDPLTTEFRYDVIDLYYMKQFKLSEIIKVVSIV